MFNLAIHRRLRRSLAGFVLLERRISLGGLHRAAEEEEEEKLRVPLAQRGALPFVSLGRLRVVGDLPGLLPLLHEDGFVPLACLLDAALEVDL